MDEAEQVGGHAGGPAGFGHDLGTPSGPGRRLEDDAIAGGEGGDHTPAWDGDREVPRRDDGDDAERRELGGGDPLEFEAALGVPTGEVDGLADLRVGLWKGLAGLVRHGHEQVVVAGHEFIGHPAQDLAALGRRSGRPGHLCSSHPGDRGVDLGHRGGGRRRRRRGSSVGQRRQPRPGRGHRGVGVGLVGEADLGHLDGLGPAAGCRADGPAQGDGLAEAVGLFGELRRAGSEREEVVEEVLGSGVLLEASKQVTDRHVEVGPPDDGRVEQQAVGGVAYGSGLGGRHALEHLELDPVGDASLFGQQVGPGHVEEVVAGEADAHGVGVSGTQRPVDAALVVGVDLGLGGVGRLGPAVNLGLDPFHRQVGALDQADLDLGPSRCTASLRPLGEPSQGIEGVGQVGLQDDPGLEAGQVRLVE